MVHAVGFSFRHFLFQPVNEPFVWLESYCLHVWGAFHDDFLTYSKWNVSIYLSLALCPPPFLAIDGAAVSH